MPLLQSSFYAPGSFANLNNSIVPLMKAVELQLLAQGTLYAIYLELEINFLEATCSKDRECSFSLSLSHWSGRYLVILLTNRLFLIPCSVIEFSLKSVEHVYLFFFFLKENTPTVLHTRLGQLTAAMKICTTLSHPFMSFMMLISLSRFSLALYSWFKKDWSMIFTAISSRPSWMIKRRKKKKKKKE